MARTITRTIINPETNKPEKRQFRVSDNYQVLKGQQIDPRTGLKFTEELDDPNLAGKMARGAVLPNAVGVGLGAMANMGGRGRAGVQASGMAGNLLGAAGTIGADYLNKYAPESKRAAVGAGAMATGGAEFAKANLQNAMRSGSVGQGLLSGLGAGVQGAIQGGLGMTPGGQSLAQAVPGALGGMVNAIRGGGWGALQRGLGQAAGAVLSSETLGQDLPKWFQQSKASDYAQGTWGQTDIADLDEDAQKEAFEQRARQEAGVPEGVDLTAEEWLSDEWKDAREQYKAAQGIKADDAATAAGKLKPSRINALQQALTGTPVPPKTPQQPGIQDPQEASKNLLRHRGTQAEIAKERENIQSRASDLQAEMGQPVSQPAQPQVAGLFTQDELRRQAAAQRGGDYSAANRAWDGAPTPPPPPTNIAPPPPPLPPRLPTTPPPPPPPTTNIKPAPYISPGVQQKPAEQPTMQASPDPAAAAPVAPPAPTPAQQTQPVPDVAAQTPPTVPPPPEPQPQANQPVPPPPPPPAPTSPAQAAAFPTAAQAQQQGQQTPPGVVPPPSPAATTGGLPGAQPAAQPQQPQAQPQQQPQQQAQPQAQPQQQPQAQPQAQQQQQPSMTPQTAEETARIYQDILGEGTSPEKVAAKSVEDLNRENEILERELRGEEPLQDDLLGLSQKTYKPEGEIEYRTARRMPYRRRGIAHELTPAQERLREQGWGKAATPTFDEGIPTYEEWAGERRPLEPELIEPQREANPAAPPIDKTTEQLKREGFKPTPDYPDEPRYASSFIQSGENPDVLRNMFPTGFADKNEAASIWNIAKALFNKKIDGMGYKGETARRYRNDVIKASSDSLSRALNSRTLPDVVRTLGLFPIDIVEAANRAYQSLPAGTDPRQIRDKIANRIADESMYNPAVFKAAQQQWNQQYDRDIEELRREQQRKFDEDFADEYANPPQAPSKRIEDYLEPEAPREEAQEFGSVNFSNRAEVNQALERNRDLLSKTDPMGVLNQRIGKDKRVLGTLKQNVEGALNERLEYFRSIGATQDAADTQQMRMAFQKQFQAAENSQKGRVNDTPKLKDILGNVPFDPTTLERIINKGNYNKQPVSFGREWQAQEQERIETKYRADMQRRQAEAQRAMNEAQLKYAADMERFKSPQRARELYNKRVQDITKKFDTRRHELLEEYNAARTKFNQEDKRLKEEYAEYVKNQEAAKKERSEFRQYAKMKAEEEVAKIKARRQFLTNPRPEDLSPAERARTLQEYRDAGALDIPTTEMSLDDLNKQNQRLQEILDSEAGGRGVAPKNLAAFGGRPQEEVRGQELEKLPEGFNPPTQNGEQLFGGSKGLQEEYINKPVSTFFNIEGEEDVDTMTKGENPPAMEDREGNLFVRTPVGAVLIKHGGTDSDGKDVKMNSTYKDQLGKLREVLVAYQETKDAGLEDPALLEQAKRLYKAFPPAYQGYEPTNRFVEGDKRQALMNDLIDEMQSIKKVDRLKDRFARYIANKRKFGLSAQDINSLRTAYKMRKASIKGEGAMGDRLLNKQRKKGQEYQYSELVPEKVKQQIKEIDDKGVPRDILAKAQMLTKNDLPMYVRDTYNNMPAGAERDQYLRAAIHKMREDYVKPENVKSRIMGQAVSQIKPSQIVGAERTKLESTGMGHKIKRFITRGQDTYERMSKATDVEKEGHWFSKDTWEKNPEEYTAGDIARMAGNTVRSTRDILSRRRLEATRQLARRLPYLKAFEHQVGYSSDFEDRRRNPESIYSMTPAERDYRHLQDLKLEAMKRKAAPKQASYRSKEY